MSSHSSDFDGAFSFAKSDGRLLIGNELFYINSIIETSRNKQKEINNLNEKILKKYHLEYADGRIQNVEGSTSKVFIEIFAEALCVRKVAKNEQCIKYIEQEKRILDLVETTHDEEIIQACLKRIVDDKQSIVFELASDTLDSYCRKNKFFDDEKKKNLIIKVCSAFKRFHQAGLLHRDIKPNNIFIFEKEREEPIIKIGDFGLSIKESEEENERNENRYSYGCLDYISPEQHNNLSSCSALTEVYSLGKVINFVMTGSPNNYYHCFNSISRKCTDSQSNRRYTSVNELITAINVTQLY
jgi:serine/threonine protein kinase